TTSTAATGSKAARPSPNASTAHLKSSAGPTRWPNAPRKRRPAAVSSKLREVIAPAVERRQRTENTSEYRSQSLGADQRRPAERGGAPEPCAQPGRPSRTNVHLRLPIDGLPANLGRPARRHGSARTHEPKPRRHDRFGWLQCDE